jgi:hypothetical protein
MKIRSRGNQAFNVPNAEEGHLFVRLMRKFRNRGWYYRARGRGSRKEHGSQAGIPQEFAEWFAVYLEQQKPQANPPPAQEYRNGQWLPGDPAVGSELAAIFSANVAQWSAQIGAGDPVAVDHDGLIYNAEVHGVGQIGIQIGTAIGDSVGSIGEGEARVPVRLDLGDALLPPAMKLPIAEKAGDVVQLTNQEQETLEHILYSYWNAKSGNCTDEEQEVLDALMEKLID